MISDKTPFLWCAQSDEISVWISKALDRRYCKPPSSHARTSDEGRSNRDIDDFVDTKALLDRFSKRMVKRTVSDPVGTRSWF